MSKRKTFKIISPEQLEVIKSKIKDNENELKKLRKLKPLMKELNKIKKKRGLS